MEPHYHSFDEFQNRNKKLELILEAGVNPYPAKFSPEHRAGVLSSHFDGDAVGNSEAAAEGQTSTASVAGRLVLFRAMGKNAFGHIQDETGRLQIMFNRDITTVTGFEGEKPLKFIEKMIDLGDIIGIEGHLFRTQKGELTLFAKNVTLLCKTLLPLPDKHAGLHDKETRYRKRWLDLISHPEVAQTFRHRSKILKVIRHELETLGFIEVETPILQTIYGGAAAKPFITHLESLDQEMFLRISLEIALKKLIVGGIDRVFEIGKVFRNEGIDRNHNPEFTLLELYGAYWDYNDVMHFMETLCEKIALELFGTTLVGEIEFKAPWPRLPMKEAIRKYADVDVDTLNDDELRKLLPMLDPLQINKAPRGILIAFVFEELVEDKLIQPVHITDHPIETTPLCKPHKEAGLIERVESYVLGHELCNGYSELNDPVLQRKLLVEQNDRREEGDEEASPLDEEFIESICQGMPPTGGLGIGIDRLVMLFTQMHSIRDVIYFPLMRREE